MNSSLQSTKFILSFLAVLSALQTAQAQPSPPVIIDAHAGLSAEQVVASMVRKNLERSQALEAYRATRIYRLEYRGFPGSRTAEMIVDVKYHSPATKEFSIRSQKGSQLLIDRVFQRMIESEKEAVTEDYQRRIEHIDQPADACAEDDCSMRSGGHSRSYVPHVKPVCPAPDDRN